MGCVGTNSRRIDADDDKQVEVARGLPNLLRRLFRPFYRLLLHGATEVRVVHGLPVAIHNDRLDVDTDHVVARLDAALSTIASNTPQLYQRMCQDFSGFVLQSYPTRAAYQPWNRTCIVETTFLGNASFGAVQLAAAIVRESAVARIRMAGVTVREPPAVM